MIKEILKDLYEGSKSVIDERYTFPTKKDLVISDLYEHYVEKEAWIQNSNSYQQDELDVFY